MTPLEVLLEKPSRISLKLYLLHMLKEFAKPAELGKRVPQQQKIYNTYCSVPTPVQRGTMIQ